MLNARRSLYGQRVSFFGTLIPIGPPECSRTPLASVDGPRGNGVPVMRTCILARIIKSRKMTPRAEENERHALCASSAKRVTRVKSSYPLIALAKFVLAFINDSLTIQTVSTLESAYQSAGVHNLARSCVWWKNFVHSWTQFEASWTGLQISELSKQAPKHLRNVSKDYLVIPDNHVDESGLANLLSVFAQNTLIVDIHERQCFQRLNVSSWKYEYVPFPHPSRHPGWQIHKHGGALP